MVYNVFHIRYAACIRGRGDSNLISCDKLIPTVKYLGEGTWLYITLLVERQMLKLFGADFVSQPKQSQGGRVIWQGN